MYLHPIVQALVTRQKRSPICPGKRSGSTVQVGDPVKDSGKISMMYGRH